MKALHSINAVLRALVIILAVAATAFGMTACSSGKSDEDTQWATMKSASPTQMKGKGPVYTYDATLVGTVKDEEGYPLETVSVVALIPGDPHVFAAATDKDGKYELKYPKKLVKEIEFSMLGKEKVTLPIGKKKKIDVVLKDEALELDPGYLDQPTGAFRIIQ